MLHTQSMSVRYSKVYIYGFQNVTVLRTSCRLILLNLQSILIFWKIILFVVSLQTLLPAANLLQLTDVRDACCEFLLAQLHPTNCLGIKVKSLKDDLQKKNIYWKWFLWFILTNRKSIYCKKIVMTYVKNDRIR